MRASHCRIRVTPLLVAALAALAALVACKSFHPAPLTSHDDGDRIVITEAMIERSGGQNAWEVLQREAPQLTFGENRNGQATGLERRGHSSILLHDTPLVIIDGVRNQDLRALQQLPSSALLSIEVLTGIEGTTYYGTDAVSGVIVIHTKNGNSPD